MPLLSPPKKRSRRESDDDASYRSDTGNDDEDEHDDFEDGDELPHGKGDLISPDAMLQYIESFQKYVKSRGKLSLPWSRMKGLFEEWCRSSGNTIDPDSLLKSFKRYLSSSLRPTVMSIDCGLRNVRDYLDRPASILMHSDFPQKPPSLVTLYGKKFGCAAGFGKVRETYDRMKADQTGRADCERELNELEASYLGKLEEFLTTHQGTLRPKQEEFVEHRIKLLRRKLFPPQRAQKAKSNKHSNGRREEKTAFDLFCSTKQDKYTDLPAERRLQKLRKKFEKLPDDKREIFEKLALVQ